ncbi:alpha/beta hydrolase-fold protein [Aquiflexum lacus]|uniref:alpha/beta hydrolase-fold protein n=1 Tax=Aquiflexum lacus TaxID=2483805 RepID=UPI001894F934|nr:alpha/beta hydrolase-fold protein [Aquiflexum lacus]
MKNTFTLLILALMAIGCDLTNKSGSELSNDNQIMIGHIDSLQSDILGETRKIWVHLPMNYQEGKKYPVLYLLDGDGHFHSVTGLIKQLSRTLVLPEMIVIAIPNTNRSRDLIPTHADVDYRTGNKLQYDSGGGSAFLDFIEEELIPYVDSTYPTTSYRTYVGHSFGGLSVIHALTTKSHLFNNYVAIDASFWWDDMAYLETVDSLLSVNDYTNKGLFLGVANTMIGGQNISNVEEDTSASSTLIRSQLKFAKSLEKKDNGLHFEWKYYQNDNHFSVPLITTYDGLRFLFDWYRLKSRDELYWSPNDESLEVVKSHYENVSQKMGYEIKPDEALINSLGNRYLRDKKMDQAAACFDFNIANFPNSDNVYDSRGDCYLAVGDSLKALEFYRKALETGDNDYSQEKIDRISKALKK